MCCCHDKKLRIFRLLCDRFSQYLSLFCFFVVFRQNGRLFVFLRNIHFSIEILKIKILEYSYPPSQYFFVKKAFIRFFSCRRKVALCHLAEWHMYIATKDHMKKYQKEDRQFLAEIGPEAFKRPLLTHRIAITTGWKRVGRVSRDNTKARDSILEEDLAKNVSFSLHNSFCLNREFKTKGLPNQAARLQKQREWMRSYEQLRVWVCQSVIFGSLTLREAKNT